MNQEIEQYWDSEKIEEMQKLVSPFQSRFQPAPKVRKTKEQRIEEERKLPVASPAEIRQRAIANLSRLKQSSLSPNSIKYFAEALVRQSHKGLGPVREWVRLDKSRAKTKGKEVVKSLDAPANFWPETRVAHRTSMMGRSRRKKEAVKRLEVNGNLS